MDAERDGSGAVSVQFKDFKQPTQLKYWIATHSNTQQYTETHHGKRNSA